MTAKFDREFRLLALLSARYPENSPFLGEFSGGAGGMDWLRFGRLVKRHRIGALVARGAAALGHIALPDPLLDKLQAAPRHNAQHYMQAVAIAGKATQALAAAGIDSVVLKGVGVASRFYPSPDDREAVDVDLLVRRRDLGAAMEIVTGQGFEHRFPQDRLSLSARETYLDFCCDYELIRRRDNFSMDLHWRCMKNPALVPWLDDGWPSMVSPQQIARFEIPVLRPAPHFIYVMVHGAKHGWVRLKWLADIDQMLPLLAEEELGEMVRLIELGGLGRLAASTFSLVHEVFGTRLPPAAQQLMQQHDGRKLHALGKSLIVRELPGKRRNLGHVGHFRDRMRNSLALHRGKFYRRRALLQEVARPDDLAEVSLTSRNLWMLGLVSPVLAVKRALKKSFARPDAS